jgi:hypothetical protein
MRSVNNRPPLTAATLSHDWRSSHLRAKQIAPSLTIAFGA